MFGLENGAAGSAPAAASSGARVRYNLAVFVRIAMRSGWAQWARPRTQALRKDRPLVAEPIPGADIPHFIAMRLEFADCGHSRSGERGALYFHSASEARQPANNHRPDSAVILSASAMVGGVSGIQPFSTDQVRAPEDGDGRASNATLRPTEASGSIAAAANKNSQLRCVRSRNSGMARNMMEKPKAPAKNSSPENHSVSTSRPTAPHLAPSLRSF